MDSVPSDCEDLDLLYTFYLLLLGGHKPPDGGNNLPNTNEVVYRGYIEFLAFPLTSFQAVMRNSLYINLDMAQMYV